MPWTLLAKIDRLGLAPKVCVGTFIQTVDLIMTDSEFEGGIASRTWVKRMTEIVPSLPRTLDQFAVRMLQPADRADC